MSKLRLKFVNKSVFHELTKTLTLDVNSVQDSLKVTQWLRLLSLISKPIHVEVNALGGFDVRLRVCACTFCPFKGLDYLQCAHSLCMLLLGQRF